MKDAHAELLKALRARAGADAEIVEDRSVPWHSATFAGARHIVTLMLPDHAAARFRNGIEDAQFRLRGHIVADISVVIDDGFVQVEALTICESA